MTSEGNSSMRRTVTRLALAVALAIGSAAAFVPPAQGADPIALTQSIEAAYPGQTKPFVGQSVTFTAELGADSANRSFVLQKYTSKWGTDKSGKADATGKVTIVSSTTAAERKFRVYAAKSGALPVITTAEATVQTQTDSVTLSVVRVSNTLQITGVASPYIADRGFTLQYKSGSSWKDLSTATATAGGKIAITTGVDGSKSYRLQGAALGAVPAVTSNTVAFSATPATLGKNVIYVTTNSGGTPTTKGKDYPGKATLVANGVVTGPLTLETIAVRGNSSATKPKKPYKLKFADKQAPFGMVKDRTWILLANYVDRTLVRSKVAFELGKKQDGLSWTADSTFTELYINGAYIGSYQLTQSIKIDSKRMNLNKKYGQVIENDPHYASDGVPGFKGLSGMPFSFKDPDEWKTKTDGSVDPEGLTTEKVTAVTKKINVFEAILYGKDKKRDWSNPGTLADCTWADFTLTTTALSAREWTTAATCDWEDFMGMASAVDYILVREFTKDNDADFYRSNFFSVNDYRSTTEKLQMGPVWDFDRSAGAHDAEGTNIEKSSGWWTNGGGSSSHNTNKIHWFTRIWKDARFVSALKARWTTKKADYEAVSKGDDSGVNLAVAQLDDLTATTGATDSQVAANDRAKWGSSGSRYAAKSSSYAGEVKWLKNWYAERYAWMDIAIGSFPIVTSP